MAHKARIGGTYYAIKGGKTKISGTNYSVQKGKTKVSGTIYDISFTTIATFTLAAQGYRKEYQFVVGMTITEWVNSEYNTDGWTYRSSDGEVLLQLYDSSGNLIAYDTAWQPASTVIEPGMEY